ncbi:DMT family transporter [Corticicoccus populi]|uniref:DMT family transporter n=1 Tax=Corticicoccus populi TaxID=1812821 RepID=A0ABW5WYC9_9STAP
MYALILLGIIGGTFIPAQTAVNTRLKQFTGSVFITSFYSFLVGTTLLFLANLFINPGYFSTDFFMSQNYSYIWFFGGIFGVIFLTGNIILLPKIGASLTVIMTVSGQMISSFLIDTFGWFNASPKDVHLMHIVGILLLIFGVIFMNARRTVAVPGANSRIWILFGLFTGTLVPMQTAVNGALNEETGSFVFATLISFTVGTTILLILSLLIEKRISLKFQAGTEKLKLWHFLGGLLGASTLAFNALLMPELGATLTMMAVIVGQILMGLLIDQLGLFGLPKQRIDARRLAAVAMIVTGILLLQFF